MLPRTILPPVAAALTLFAISHSGYAQQTIYDTDTTISTQVNAVGFWVTNDATLTVTTGGILTTQGLPNPSPTFTSIGTSDGFGRLIVNGSGVVNVDVGPIELFPRNLWIGLLPGHGGEMTVEDNGIVNVGGGFHLGPRSPATVNLADNGVINIGLNGALHGAPSGEFRVGWLSDLCPEEGCDPPRTVEINQTGGTLDASFVNPIFNRFNTEFLDGLDWNFSGGVIRFSGDRQDIVNEEWFNAQAEIAVSYDINNDVTTIVSVDGLPCDANSDDVCDTDDLQILLDNFLMTDPRPTRLEGNFNFDPTVDHQDFLIWRDEFLAGGGSLAEISAFLDGNPVPEPSTLWLIGMSGVALVARFPRR
ncbi:PEP-CTERM sorting domain-containing protein [Pirellulales bacterium]|nr:PEP-CTERM sorting domain-containing protein [Pirellulales bacterium]